MAASASEFTPRSQAILRARSTLPMGWAPTHCRFFLRVPGCGDDGSSRIAEADAARFRQRRKELQLGPLVIHGNYLINLASPNPVLRTRSVQAFHQEIVRALALGADYLVIHPGSALGTSVDSAIAAMAQGLRQAARGLKLGDLRILLENTAGQGSTLGSRFEELKAILDACPDLPLGVCVDTAHLFAAGWRYRHRGGPGGRVARYRPHSGLGPRGRRSRQRFEDASWFPRGPARAHRKRQDRATGVRQNSESPAAREMRVHFGDADRQAGRRQAQRRGSLEAHGACGARHGRGNEAAAEESRQAARGQSRHSNEERDHGGSEIGRLRFTADRSEVAEGLGRAGRIPRGRRRCLAPEILPARDAAVSFRHAAHGPHAQLHDRRRRGALQVDVRLQRAASDRLGRLRAARGKCRDQERHSSARLDQREYSRNSGASASASGSATTGGAKSPPASRNITGGISGFSCACSRRESPTGRRAR